MKWLNCKVTLLIMFALSGVLVTLGHNDVIRLMELIASGYIGYLQKGD